MTALTVLASLKTGTMIERRSGRPLTGVWPAPASEAVRD